ncbi:MAG: hypothetical protein GQ574_21495 [Crocinitomix sp.]|nr:hypothetical protein [Crocinitomix sp.]
MKNVGCFLILLSLFSCVETITDSDNAVEKEEVFEDPINDQTPLGIVENVIAIGSQKAMLIGNWQAADDAELAISISPDKYSTYVNGEKNWDNPWSLCDYIDYAPENENENGKFVLVHVADKSSVFYAQEIISLTETQLDVKIVKSSAGSGMTQTFIRI